MIRSPEDFLKAFLDKPHLVLIGAGASRAALPNGDRNGWHLPLMADFVSTLRLEPLLRELGVTDPARNFEEIFAELHQDGHPGLARLERAIEDYFLRLELPDEPTLYDCLMLSLRDHDVVATFNWDPFLVQALRRNRRKNHLIFLHGNVATGFCEADSVLGLRGARCSACGDSLRASRLLYPIRQKDYSADSQIAHAWEGFRYVLSHAMLFSIFGYGAPDSDIDAMDAIRQAWGKPTDRAFEQIEMIDIRSEKELEESWRPLIHTHHYEVHRTYAESWLGQHGPLAYRRFVAQFIEAQFIDTDPVPLDVGFDELRAWFERTRQKKP